MFYIASSVLKLINTNVLSICHFVSLFYMSDDMFMVFIVIASLLVCSVRV